MKCKRIVGPLSATQSLNMAETKHHPILFIDVFDAGRLPVLLNHRFSTLLECTLLIVLKKNVDGGQMLGALVMS